MLSHGNLGDGWCEVPQVVLVLVATLRDELCSPIDGDGLVFLDNSEFLRKAEAASLALVAVCRCLAVHGPVDLELLALAGQLPGKLRQLGAILELPVA